MRRKLKKEFFDRSAIKVAGKLLGKYLVRKIGVKNRAYMITEVEVYDGHKDKASHARSGKTKRNWPMYGPAGKFYIYFTYGMHHMLNIVCGKKEYPSAILIRGVKDISGPGRLTKALKIDKKLNALAAGPKTGLWFEDKGVRIKKSEIKRTPRVGIDHAGKYWGRKPWRFVV